MTNFSHCRFVLNAVVLTMVAIVAGCATATSKPQKAAAPEPSEPPTKVVMKEVVLDARTLFAFDSARLTSEGKAKLDSLISEASRRKSEEITVTGHTDRIGSQEYNMDLSRRRAESVAEYMVSKGVPARVIKTIGRGETEPVVQCEDQNWDALVACLQPNRRVHVQYTVMVEEEVVVDE